MNLNVNKHYDYFFLEAMVKGKLSEAQVEEVSQHVSECESCLAQLDQLWATTLRIPEPVPRLEPQQAKRMERELVRHLHREALGANMIWLATKGLLNVILTLIRPFFSWMAFEPSLHDTAPKESKS